MKESNRVPYARVKTAGPQSRSIFSINTVKPFWLLSSGCFVVVFLFFIFFYFLRLGFPGGTLLLFSHSALSDSRSVRLH